MKLFKKAWETFCMSLSFAFCVLFFMMILILGLVLLGSYVLASILFVLASPIYALIISICMNENEKEHK